LPLEFAASPGLRELDRNMVARLCYFSNGVTKVLRGMPFRAAACTGALYHIELYLICADLPELAAGVYHYGAHDHALRQLRSGDFRAIVGSSARASLAFTTTYWRNAWKYQARAYRHAFWDSGTMLANLFSVAFANGVDAKLHIAFHDRDVNSLLDVDPDHEATVVLVTLGADQDAIEVVPSPPLVSPLNLPTRPLSAHEVDYPLIRQAHHASSVSESWPINARLRTPFIGDDSVEAVILRRGSSRRFTQDPITFEQLNSMLDFATQPVSSDAPWPLSDVYVIANAVDGLASGTYFFNRDRGSLELLELGGFRREAAYLSLGQTLAGDAAVNVYWLSALEQVIDRLGQRAYRAAQLEAAIEGGQLYLAAYALRLGATGLTFFDDDVTDFFSAGAAGEKKSVMFLTAVGHPAALSQARR
jgi:SagB-type dehydrogenase family enzyme